MTNKEIYSKTIKFSIFRLLYDIVAFLILAALTVGGFFIAEATIDNGFIGLGAGALVGIIVIAIMLRFLHVQGGPDRHDDRGHHHRRAPR